MDLEARRLTEDAEFASFDSAADFIDLGAVVLCIVLAALVRFAERAILLFFLLLSLNVFSLSEVSLGGIYFQNTRACAAGGRSDDVDGESGPFGTARQDARGDGRREVVRQETAAARGVLTAPSAARHSPPRQLARE